MLSIEGLYYLWLYSDSALIFLKYLYMVKSSFWKSIFGKCTRFRKFTKINPSENFLLYGMRGELSGKYSLGEEVNLTIEIEL